MGRCVLCSEIAVGDVEVAPGLLVGMCRSHMIRHYEAQSAGRLSATPFCRERAQQK